MLHRAYLPFAACLAGSGDPDFLELKGDDPQQPALVRVPHHLEDLDCGGYPEERIELVRRSLGEFFHKASVD